MGGKTAVYDFVRHEVDIFFPRWLGISRETHVEVLWWCVADWMESWRDLRSAIIEDWDRYRGAGIRVAECHCPRVTSFVEDWYYSISSIIFFLFENSSIYKKIKLCEIKKKVNKK